MYAYTPFLSTKNKFWAKRAKRAITESVQTNDVIKQNLNSKIYNLTNEIAETKADLNELSYRLKYNGLMRNAVLVLSTYNSGNKPMVVTFGGKIY